MRKRLVVGFTAVLVTGAIAAPPYVTEEFQQGNSHIATAFICGVVGQETGIEPDALVWVIRMMKNTGADAKHTGRLLADAAVWMSAESGDIDLMKMWVGECKGPMAVIGEAFGD